VRAALRLAAAAAALALACDRSAEPPGAAPAATASGFDAARAMRDLEALVRIGPRPAGSEGAAQARALIRERLRQAGWPAEEHAFEARPKDRPPVPMANVLSRKEGASAERLLLITHYDTKDLDGMRFVGANDGASGTAVLLELARVLAPEKLPLGIELVFADGEEAFGRSITAEDGLYGSTALAERMHADGSLARVRAVILVDMVGDRDQNLVFDLGNSPLLREIFEREARNLGEPELFDLGAAMSVIDDHTPFAQRGIPHVLVLMDFQFGARVSPGPLWHTAGDDLASVSEASLGRIGKVLVAGVRASARSLASSGAGPQETRAPAD
jgi:glutaminyl-peptide cyclotransferase